MKKKNLILGSILALVGLLMTVMPAACIKAVVILVGLAAVVLGGYNLLFVYKKIQIPEFKKSILIKGITSIVVGLIAVICPFVLLKTAVSIWKIFSYILSAYLILFAAYGFYTSTIFDENFKDEKKKLIKENLTCILIAALLIIIPIESVGKSFVRIVGIAGLFIGLFLILLEIVISKRTTVVKTEDVVIVDDEPAETQETKEAEVEESVPENSETSETVESEEKKIQE